MKKYIVNVHAGVRIVSGMVELTKEQAERRAGKVTPVKDRTGIYEVKSPTMFKKGEKFGYDGSVSKALLSELIDEAEAAKVAEASKPASAATAAKPKK